MSVRHLTLAMLTRQDMYGYELKSTYEKTLAVQGTLNLGQIYSTLIRLERDGLVRALPESGDERKTYTITEEGRAELGRWLCDLGEWEVYTDSLSYKLAAAEYLNREMLLRCLIEYRVLLIRKLQEMTRYRQTLPEERWGAALVIERNLNRLEADIRWLDVCTEKITHREGTGYDTT